LFFGTQFQLRRRAIGAAEANRFSLAAKLIPVQRFATAFEHDAFSLFRQRRSLRMTSMISVSNQHRFLKRIPCAVLVLFFWFALISFGSASANALDQKPADLILENVSYDAQNSASEKIRIAQSPEASLKNSAPCLMARIQILSDQKSNETLVELQINIGNRTWAYFCARYYHAQLGRFISRDPSGFVDGMSLYRGYFVPGGMDPLGLQGILFPDRKSANLFADELKNKGAKHVRLYQTIAHDIIKQRDQEVCVRKSSVFVYTDFRDTNAIFEFADEKLPPKTKNSERNRFLLNVGILPNIHKGEYFDGGIFSNDESPVAYHITDPIRVSNLIERPPNLIIDIGGEGRIDDAININVQDKTSTTFPAGRPIPRLFQVSQGETLPFPKGSVSKAVSQGSPFYFPPYPKEIPRILAPEGKYEVWSTEESMTDGLAEFRKVNPGMKNTSPKKLNVDWYPGGMEVIYSAIEFPSK